MKNKDNICGGCAKRTSIGGQALIEGIMMRGPELSAMAVRDPDGEIVLEKWETQARFKAKFFKLPFVRGTFNFIDSMMSGYKCLMRSAEIAGLEDESPQKQNTEENDTNIAPSGDESTLSLAVNDDMAQVCAAEEKSESDVPMADVTASAYAASEITEENEAEKKPAAKKTEKKADPKEKSSGALMAVISVISLVLGVAISIGLFIYLPAQLYSWLSIPFPRLEGNRFLRSLFEGVLRIAVFIAYMALVSLMKDIRRTYMYHGAEHKTIFCYEKGLPLTVENVRAQVRFHPRCGTSFMILMLIVGVFLGMLIPASIHPIPLVNNLLRTVVKLCMLPITMGIGYELIRLAGRSDNLFTRIVSKPGVWLQHLTTIEPTDDMIECAILAFREVIPEGDKDNW